MSIIFHGDNPVWEPEWGGGRPVRVMSTFSGIGAASISWQPNETVLTDTGKVPRFDFVAYSEIDPFPCHVLHYRRGASRPKYMPDPGEEGISEKDRDERARKIEDVSLLPETGIINFGDITQITDDDLRRLGPVDILEGGPPCQTFSLAGARKGLNDPRGNMVVRFCELAERMHKINGLLFVVWENVHGALSDKTNVFGFLLAALAGVPGALDPCPGEEATKFEPPSKRKWGWKNAGRVLGPKGRTVAWRTIQASHWGVPQKRKRVFAVASLATGRAAAGAHWAEEVLFEHEGSFWHLRHGLKTRQGVVATYRSGDRLEYRSAADRYRDPHVRARLEAENSRDWIGAGLTNQAAVADIGSQPSESSTATSHRQTTAYALSNDYSPKASKESAYTLMAGSRSGGGHKQMVVISPRQNSGTLSARAAAPIGKSSQHNFVVITKKEGDDNPKNWIVRHFTPLECERLQGFPDYWTDVPFKGELVADGHRYKAIGNSMACPVMAYIGNRLEVLIEAYEDYQYSPHLFEPERKRGRPPKNGISAMTPAERQRRRRERLRQAASLEA